MEQSRRAVESYWRSRMIDGATSDEDKVTPVYKLEEICDLLRSSHVGIVKEVSEFVLKRLQHKSPVVKQKALRVIKYAVGKSGAEFKREMQRNSVAVRQLIHYKGMPDPLKGDALNKSVRETAQEALSAIFSSEDTNKPAPIETSLGSRIQGFGNTNYEMPVEDKTKSFISEVVDLGSTTLKQGLSSLTQSPSLRKANKDVGSYRGPNLRRSLTGEKESEYSGEVEGSSRFSSIVSGGGWGGRDVSGSSASGEVGNGGNGSGYGEKSREEKLLETIVTSGGVRLQPTRDALQVFLAEALKVDALGLVHALEAKLGSPLWQVRMKAVCVLEAILRKKDDEHFAVIKSYFSDNEDLVLKCSESPQASLREKANKVLSLLGGEENGRPESSAKSVATPPVQMPDLIDTSDDFLGMQDSSETQIDQTVPNPTPSASVAPLIDDLFGESIVPDAGTNQKSTDDDPFADVSFHGNTNKNDNTDLFSGMNTEKSADKASSAAFDLFGSSEEVLPVQKDVTVTDFMASLSLDKNDQFINPSGNSSLNSLLSPQASAEMNMNTNTNTNTNTNSNTMAALGAMGYNFGPGLMFNNSAFGSQPNYKAMENLFAQQQLLAAMSNFQNLQANAGAGSHGGGGSIGGGSSPLPDIFNPGLASQAPTSMLNESKKEDTRAFDFISDHLASARDPKRVI